MTFFQSIWAWLSEHGTAVLAVVAVITLVVMGMTIYCVIKMHKAVKTSNAVAEKLATAVKAINSNSNVSADVSGIKEKVDEIEETNAHLLIKENALLQILQILCASIKQLTPESKVVIDNLVANAEYAETKTRAELLKLLDGARAELAEANEKVNQTVARAAKLVSTSADDTPAEYTVRG